MKAEDELEAVKGRLADIEQAQREIMREPCNGDERHCTCVPLLRLEVQRLRALCKESGKMLNKIHLEPGDDFLENNCRVCKLVKRLREAGEGK